MQTVLMPASDNRAFASWPEAANQNTAPAMSPGAYWGYVAVLDELAARMKANDGRFCPSNGVAALFEGGGDLMQRLGPDLTVQGLLQVLNRAPALAAH